MGRQPSGAWLLESLPGACYLPYAGTVQPAAPSPVRPATPCAGALTYLHAHDVLHAGWVLLTSSLFHLLPCAGALTYLHAHDVLHGDLTPSNVLLTSSTKDGRRWQAKVGEAALWAHSCGCHGCGDGPALLAFS